MRTIEIANSFCYAVKIESLQRGWHVEKRTPLLMSTQGPPHPAGQWKLLVIDDEVGIGESLCLILGTMGFQVTYIDNGEEAIQKLRQQHFDVVIADLVMDTVSGYDILEFVHQEGLSTPVIMLTGLDSVEAAVRALKLGAYDYILKPYELDSFKKSVLRAVEKRQLEMIQRLQQQRLEAIASIAKAATSTLKLDEIFKILIEQTGEFVRFDQAALLILNEEEMMVELFAAALNGQMVTGLKSKLSIDHPLFAELYTSHRSVLIKDAAGIKPWITPLVLLQEIESYVLIPLITKDRLVGALFFGSVHKDNFHQQDLEFLVPIADQISVAIDNARLLELELHRSRQLEIINHIGRQLTFALATDKLLEKAVALLKAHFHFQQCDIYYYDDKRQQLLRLITPDATAPVDEAIVSKAAEAGRTVLVQNAPSIGQFKDSSWGQLAVPLKSDSEVLGVLNIQDTPSRILSEVETAVIEAIAVQISLAWKNAKLFEQTCHDKNYLELVLAAAEDTAIITFDDEGKIITFNSGAEKILALPAAQAAGKPISAVIQNDQLPQILEELNSGDKSNSWEGEISIIRPDQKSLWANIHIWPIEPSTGRHMGFLIVLTDITARVELNQKLTQLTVTDDLTGLYNQRYFFEQLTREIERAERRGAPLALCIFDIDKFKLLNDTRGHLAGDEILSTVGGLVAGTIRNKIDSAFRYGGDEFVLLLPETNINQAATLVERLRASIQQRLENKITISAGVVEYSSGLSDRELVDAADKLLYIAKRKGGNQVIFEGHTIATADG